MKRLTILSILLLVLFAVSVEGALPTITVPTTLTATEGTAYSGIVSAADADNASAVFNFSFTNSPSWMTISTLTGVKTVTLSGTPNSGADPTITVTATDSGNLTSTNQTQFTLTVNGKPVITSTPTTTVVAGQTYTYTIAATEPEGEAMTYSLQTRPTGMTIANNVVTWVPAETSGGTSHSVVVRVTSGTLYTDQSFTITVQTPAAPSLSAPVNVTIGDNNQRRSNPGAEDDKDINIRGSTTLTLTNNGGYTLSNFAYVPPTSIVYTSKYSFNITVTGLPTTLAPGASAALTVAANVVPDLDAVDGNLAETAFKIADLAFRATASNSQAVSAASGLNMQAENQLDISEAEVCIDDDCESVDDGDKITDIKPESNADVKIAAENKYKDSESEDVDIDDVEVSLEIDEDDLRESESEDIGTISANEEEEETLSFEIDDSVKNGGHSMLLRAVGETEYGAKMGKEISISLDVGRESHELKVINTLLTPSQLSCVNPEKAVELKFDVKNIGKKDEDKVVVKISSDRLGVTPQTTKDIEIKKEKKKSVAFTIQLPEKMQSGLYPVKVETFYDTTQSSGIKELLLTVPKCGVYEEADEDAEAAAAAAAAKKKADEEAKLKEEKESIEVKGAGETPETAGETATALPEAAGVTKSSLKSVGYIVILAGAAVVLILIGIVLIAALVKRS